MCGVCSSALCLTGVNIKCKVDGKKFVMILPVCNQPFPSVSDSWRRRLTFDDECDSGSADSDNSYPSSSSDEYDNAIYYAEKGASEEEVQHEVVKSGM